MPQVDAVQTSTIDDTCEVDCECGCRPFIAGEAVYRCACGRGYRVEMKLYSYAIDEKDVTYSDAPEICLVCGHCGKYGYNAEFKCWNCGLVNERAKQITENSPND